MIGLFTVAFPLLLIFMSYDAGWRFETMNYLQYWTIPGFFRGLLFNGHHPSCFYRRRSYPLLFENDYFGKGRLNGYCGA